MVVCTAIHYWSVCTNSLIIHLPVPMERLAFLSSQCRVVFCIIVSIRICAFLGGFHPVRIFKKSIFYLFQFRNVTRITRQIIWKRKAGETKFFKSVTKISRERLNRLVSNFYTRFWKIFSSTYLITNENFFYKIIEKN